MFPGSKLLHLAGKLFSFRGRATAVPVSLLSLFFILAVAIGVHWTLGRIEAEIKRQTADSLETVVATTREGIELWIQELKNQVSTIARRAEVVAAVQSQNHALAGDVAIRGTAALRELQRFLSPVLETYRYDFIVVDRDLLQIAGRNDEAVGARLADSPEIYPVRAALNGEAAAGLWAVHGEEGEQALAVASPVNDSNGRTLAALVFFLDPTDRFNELTHLGRIGKTGDTYVFDRSRQPITRSRFDHHPARSRTTVEILSGNSGVDVSGYRDYRGIDVVGAWSWDPVLNVGIAAEIDRTEALLPYRSIRNLTLLLLALIGATFVAMLAALIHRSRVLASNYGFREAVKARQDTLAVVSHDLRAPLNNVLLCSQLIAAPDCRPNQIDRFAGMIGRSVGQMESLISDLLDVSEMETGRLRVEKKPCALSSLLDPVRDMFSESARAQGIQLSVAYPADAPLLPADPDRIVQVLSNLVGNALKFTPAGGEVAVAAAVLPREIRFSVRDTGPGIPEEARSHVFEQFWKTKASGRKGKGLGLYIAKMIVERHSGRIWVQSDGRTGSVFHFTIPFEL